VGAFTASAGFRTIVPPDRLREGLVEHVVDLLDRGGGEATVKLLAVEAL